MCAKDIVVRTALQSLGIGRNRKCADPIKSVTPAKSVGAQSLLELAKVHQIEENGQKVSIWYEMSNQLIRSRIHSFREGVGNFNFLCFGHHLEIFALIIANFDAFTSSRGECREGCGKIKENRFKEVRTSSPLITRVLSIPLENCGAFGTTKPKIQRWKNLPLLSRISIAWERNQNSCFNVCAILTPPKKILATPWSCHVSYV